MMKKILFQDTSFRDGFQSIFGARALTKDFIPAVEAAVAAGITHFEAGGGARFQSPFLYCGESAFDMMDAFRKAVGPDIRLQTLARGINVVALEQQPADMIDLHAKMFKKHGMTRIRNFDALNDVNNLIYSGQCITDAGLEHEVVVTMMELPRGCSGAHDPEFYIKTLRQILDAGLPFTSVCFKDASGTSNPRKVHETFKQARKLLGDKVELRMHTHETCGTGLAQYIAAIEAGCDGVCVGRAPLSGGTAQPDLLSLWHALKGTDYDLDIDVEKIMEANSVAKECLKDYEFPPEALGIDADVIFSPMPGGALTANTLMMRENKTFHKYPEVIKAMAECVARGGFGTSVTPVSQFYFQQAYANVMMGPWKKMTDGYGNMVLGYFGKTPVEPDPEIVKIASEQLKKPVFTGDPIKALEPGIPKAKKVLEENGLPVTDENIFIVGALATKGGNKGLDFLKGNFKVSVPKKDPNKAAAAPAPAAPAAAPAAPVAAQPVAPSPSAATLDAPVAAGQKRTYRISVGGNAYDLQVEPM
jgi:pyruvate carboxylase subunit B